MSYFGEIRLNWQQLLAASIGIAMGSALNHYTLSLFGPPMLAEFGWSKAQFALIGSLPLISAFLIPVAGRFTDRFGARIAAMLGFTAVPLGFLGFTLMSGNIVEFFAIYVVQHAFGILTTSLVFARVIVERFDTTRGIALSILMTGPPLSGALAAPLLGELIQAEGWRAGYVALAALSGIGGWLAVLLMGRGHRVLRTEEELHLPLGQLFGLLRHPVLLLAVGGMFLVNLAQPIPQSQLKLILFDKQVGDDAANLMLSLYAIGVIIGRFVCGFALDRISTHVVAIAALGLPAIGLLVMASPMSAIWILFLAILLIGLAQGAEGDIGAFLISRRFDMKNYSLLLSLMTLAILTGSAIGSLILSYTLALTNSYVFFLIICAVTTVVGALLFFLTGSRRSEPSTPTSLAREIA